MIAFVKGRVASLDPGKAWIEVNGLGYEVRISLNTYSALQGQEHAKLYTIFQVREDAQILFGFTDLREKALFEKLVSVNGVGGNTALLVLSSLAPSELTEVILRDDTASLRRIKGIGAKTAARIILEIKDKLRDEGLVAGPLSSNPSSSIRTEAITALVNLGFPRPAMEKKVDEILNSGAVQKVDQIIKLVLKAV